MQKKIVCLKVRICVTFFAIIILLVSGCQPTPTREAIISVGNFEEKIVRTAASVSAYSTPESWREAFDIEGSDAKIEINATISVPDVTAFPVYEVTKTEFDTAQAEALVNCFTKGKDVIKYAEPTKAELESQLILAKKNNNEEWVAELNNMMETAPETTEAEKVSNWDPVKSPSGIFLIESGEYAGISTSPDTFVYMNGLIETDSMLLLNDEQKIGEISIARENAIKSAQTILTELGIKNMVADSLEKAQRYSCLSSSIYAYYSEEPVDKGYLIKFARDIDGITGITDNGVYYSYIDEYAYMAPLYPEEIQIYVNESGNTQSFIWRQPIEIKEQVEENAKLMPFSDLQQRIRDMLTFINSYDGLPIVVTRIDMHMTLIDVKDQADEAMYVPAWFIYYTKTYENGTRELELVLNAIDGGRVLETPADISPEIQQAMDKDRENLLNGQ